MDTLFFILSKLLWSLVQPDSLLLYGLVAVLVLLWRQRLMLARRLLAVLLVASLPFALLPLGHWLYAPLENRFPANPPLPAKVDGIIVLGGFLDPLVSAYWQQPELNNASERAVAFAALARRYPNAKLLMTGGSGSVRDQEFREADAMVGLSSLLALDQSRLTYERESRNTFENAVNSAALLHPQPGETWVLITSAGHMPRAVGVFCQQHWPVVPWPVDHQTSPLIYRPSLNFAGHVSFFNAALHEWAGLVVYFLTGKTDSLYPAGCTA